MKTSTTFHRKLILNKSKYGEQSFTGKDIKVYEKETIDIGI